MRRKLPEPKHATRPGVLHNLAAARLAAGETQAEAGRHLGVNQSHYRRIETGEVQAKALQVLALCNAYNLTIQEFCETVEKENK